MYEDKSHHLEYTILALFLIIILDCAKPPVHTFSISVTNNSMRNV